MAELLPCPFCGGEPYDYAIEPHSHSPALRGLGIPDHAGSHVIECGCGAGLIADTHAEVATMWNRRATPAEGAQSQRGIMKKLQRALSSIEEACVYSPHRENGSWDESLAQLIHRHARLLSAERSDKGSLAALGEQGK
jgi:hypothetical protein